MIKFRTGRCHCRTSRLCRTSPQCWTSPQCRWHPTSRCFQPRPRRRPRAHRLRPFRSRTCRRTGLRLPRPNSGCCPHSHQCSHSVRTCSIGLSSRRRRRARAARRPRSSCGRRCSAYARREARCVPNAEITKSRDFSAGRRRRIGTPWHMTGRSTCFLATAAGGTVRDRDAAFERPRPPINSIASRLPAAQARSRSRRSRRRGGTSGPCRDCKRRGPCRGVRASSRGRR